MNNEAWADKCVKQKAADYGAGSLRHPDTAAFITPWSELETDADEAPRIVGTVDMESYLDWLNANGYDIDLEVQ